MIQHSCQDPETTSAFGIILPLLRFARFHVSSFLVCSLFAVRCFVFPLLPPRRRAGPCPRRLVWRAAALPFLRFNLVVV